MIHRYGGRWRFAPKTKPSLSESYIQTRLARAASRLRRAGEEAVEGTAVVAGIAAARDGSPLYYPFIW